MRVYAVQSIKRDCYSTAQEKEDQVYDNFNVNVFNVQMMSKNQSSSTSTRAAVYTDGRGEDGDAGRGAERSTHSAGQLYRGRLQKTLSFFEHGETRAQLSSGHVSTRPDSTRV